MNTTRSSARARPALLWTTALLPLCGIGCLQATDLVEVLAPDENGDYALRTAELETAVDLRAGESTDFSLFGEVVIPTREISEPVIDSSLSRREAVAAANEHIRYAHAAPRLRVVNDVTEAVDLDALAFLTAFHHLETSARFWRSLPVAPAALEPVKVGLFSIAVREALLPLATKSSNNASYNIAADAIFFYRDYANTEDRVPFVMNLGVLAHETAHRVYFEGLLQAPGFYEAYQAFVQTEATEELTELNLVFFGFTEGISDLVGFAITNDPEFVLKSSSAEARSFNGTFAVNATLEDLYDASWVSDESRAFEERCTGAPFPEASANFYCLGTLFARTVYVAANEDAARIKNEFLPAIIEALPTIGQASADAGQFEFNVPLVLDAVADQLDATARSALCDAFAEKFAPYMEEVTSCLP